MNEGNFSEKNANTAYYGIDGEGRLFRSPKPKEVEMQDKYIVEHTLQKGAKAGQTVLRKLVPFICGKFTAFWVKTGDFGDSLIVELSENGFTAVLQMSLDSSFASDLIGKVNNVKEGETYTLQSWKMQAKDLHGKVIPEKFIRGISIKDQVGNKVEKYLTKEVQQKMLPLANCPLFDKTRSEKEQSKELWQMYLMLLLNEFKTRLIPYNKLRFQKWQEANAVIEQPRPQKVEMFNDYGFPSIEDEPQGETVDSTPVLEDLPF